MATLRQITLTKDQWDIVHRMADQRLQAARENWKPAEMEAQELYRAVMDYEEKEKA